MSPLSTSHMNRCQISIPQAARLCNTVVGTALAMLSCTDTISVRCDFARPRQSGRCRRRSGRSWHRTASTPADLPRALDERMEVLRGWQAALLRGRLRRPRVARGVRRRWPAAGRADRRRPGAGSGGRARVRQRRRARRPRPSLLRFGNDEQRRRYIPRDPLGRGDLVPGLLGARGRLRPRLAAHARGRARRPLRPQRPEDLGLLGPVRALVRRARAHGRHAARSTAASRC